MRIACHQLVCSFTGESDFVSGLAYMLVQDMLSRQMAVYGKALTVINSLRQAFQQLLLTDIDRFKISAGMHSHFSGSELLVIAGFLKADRKTFYWSRCMFHCQPNNRTGIN